MLRYSVSDLEFGACYLYSPQGRGAIASGSRSLRVRLKGADPVWLARYATRVRDLVAISGRYKGMFDADVALVPVPPSRPHAPGDVWAAESLAIMLHRHGLGAVVWPGLERHTAVRKSATSPHGKRPTVEEHLSSLAARAPRNPFRQIVIVDDIVSKGRTLLAAAITLRVAFPQAAIRAFALARTMGLVDRIEHLVAPCEGVIRWTGRDALREP